MSFRKFGFFSCLLVAGLSFGSHQVLGQVDLIMGTGSGFSRTVSVSNENGVKTTRVTENGKKFVIRQSDDLIEVEFANTYGPKDLEKLKEKHPDLHMHVTSFPKTTGNSEVELTISVKEKVSAENESALKEKNEQAFQIFEKFTKKGGLGGGPFGRIELRGGDLGGLRIAKPARLVEIEKEADERMKKIQDKVRDRIREMNKKAEGPLFGEKKSSKPKELESTEKESTEKEGTEKEDSKTDEEKGSDKPSEKKDAKESGKKKLIDI